VSNLFTTLLKELLRIRLCSRHFTLHWCLFALSITLLKEVLRAHLCSRHFTQYYYYLFVLGTTLHEVHNPSTFSPNTSYTLMLSPPRHNTSKRVTPCLPSLATLHATLALVCPRYYSSHELRITTYLSSLSILRRHYCFLPLSTTLYKA
jgi:hypothetical protein